MAVAAALPQLTHLDGSPLDRGGASAGATAQYVAAMQLQAFQPPQPPSSLPQRLEAAMQLPAAAEPHTYMQQQPLPVLAHPAATESIADRLVQRLAQSGAWGGLWGDPSSAQQQQGQSAAQREAALEARLAALLEEQQLRPLQPVLAANRRSVQQGNGGKAAGNAERRDSAAQTEVAVPDRQQRLQVLTCCRLVLQISSTA